ncbi:MAG: apolipoprotein N-acyltransferase [Candidatus Aureabacteria bacterium]|nr:apolipoprotein N-acyltransferase [Candidatus Auribacterota bacterium]
MPLPTALAALLALLSGLLLTLPFLNFSLAPLAWICLVPLILAASFRPVRAGAALGLLAGAVFGFVGVHWLRAVTGIGYSILALYLAVYWAFWGGWISFLSRRRPGWLWWAAPAGLVALEFLRSHLFTGFPWNLLGVSQALNTPVIQVSAWTGVYGVSFLVALVNAALAQFLWSGRIAAGSLVRRFFPPVAALVLVGFSEAYGRWELKKSSISPAPPSLNLCLVQGGISQDLKWDPALAGRHLATYLRLTRETFPTHPGLVLWPESAVPYYIEEEGEVRRLLKEVCAEGRLHLLLGGDARERVGAPAGPVKDRYRYFNSAYLFDPEGEIVGRYDKIHLVPYGEYVPLRRFFPFVRRMVPWDDDFSSGERPSLLSIGSAPPLAVLICYEDIFPGLVREFTRRGAGLLANVTNDAWYGRTSAPFQHAYAALFRAVENRVYLARSTNTGYSCVIDPWGRIVAEVRDRGGETLFIQGSTTAAISPRPASSFYCRYGDIFSWLCVIFSLGAMVFIWRGKRPDAAA